MLSRLLSAFLKHKRTPPPAGVRTIPCTAVDRLMAKGIVYTIGLVINARLDTKILEESLSRLIEHKFPRAGARLAFRNGAYEFQIPKTFDAKTPPTAFTVNDYHEAYNRAGRPQIPSALTGSQPSIIPLPELDQFFRSKTCPKTEADFLKPNVPLLHMHFTVFHDVTFIGLTASHAGFDLLGITVLLAAWTRVINGDDFDAIPGMEWDVQPFTHYVPAPGSSSLTPTRTSQRGWFKLGWLSQLSFIGRSVLSSIRDPKEFGYLVRVPKVFLNQEKRKIMDELKAQGSSEYVGSSDVLMAWWHKTVYSYRAPTDHTPVHLLFSSNLRSRSVFAQDGPLAHPYTNSAALYLPVPPIPVNAFRTESLGELALRVRRSIVAYNADTASLRAELHWLFEGSNATKMVFPCPPGAEFSFTTNWRDGKLGALDFSGVVVSDSRSEAVATRVVLAYFFLTSDKTLPMRGSGCVLMEDDDAVWMRQFRGSKDWERIRQSGVVAFDGH
ncbi:hypothetical protein MSAN_00580000 [Mycena sanguinolenta]|uniref:Uncharacterized protein n=1 Tax=Mycena sanguinolenta TaxID=230812 RepID=A0A8H7DGP4_9AGAR|nr:hypothetical protein MSAN_00580000 [Mycena sanguinolenta]